MSLNTNIQTEKQRELLFEYDQLRREILGNFSLGVQILGATVTFVAVIMTLGFSGAVKSHLAKAALFFVGETITFIGMLQTLSLAHSTFRIASYLRVFTEVELDDVKWETRLHEFRRVENQPYKEVTGSVRYTYAFMVTVNFVLGSAFALLDAVPGFGFRGFTNLHELVLIGFNNSHSTGVFIVSALALTVYLLVKAWKQYGRFVIQYDDTYMSTWINIKLTK
ncbi:MAG TPA: hypothetical protein VE732_03245 [Nitrososphaera sp.]|nr:hypothetical protein [Nitrososphaera sp.]